MHVGMPEYLYVCMDMCMHDVCMDTSISASVCHVARIEPMYISMC